MSNVIITPTRKAKSFHVHINLKSHETFANKKSYVNSKLKADFGWQSLLWSLLLPSINKI